MQLGMAAWGNTNYQNGKSSCFRCNFIWPPHIRRWKLLMSSYHKRRNHSTTQENCDEISKWRTDIFYAILPKRLTRCFLPHPWTTIWEQVQFVCWTRPKQNAKHLRNKHPRTHQNDLQYDGFTKRRLYKVWVVAHTSGLSQRKRLKIR